jgi:hypothetical protein
MTTLTFSDLLDLVEAEVPDTEKRIEQIFEWHFDRVKIIIQGTFGFTAGVLIALIVALFKNEIQIVWWGTMLIILSSLLPAIYGIFRLWQIRLVHHEFVTSLRLYSELREMRSFLIRYHQQVERQS